MKKGIHVKRKWNFDREIENWEDQEKEKTYYENGKNIFLVQKNETELEKWEECVKLDSFPDFVMWSEAETSLS